MSLFLRKLGLQTHPAKITYTPNPAASVSRRVQRLKRVKVSQERAVKRGDARRAGQLQEEIDSITINLLEEKADIEATIRAQQSATGDE